MKIVTCTGYFSTGSSAVGDLLSEYDICYYPNDYELRFIYDPDGIADLEYHLVENHNRHNSGHAIKRYKRLVDFYCGSKLAPKNEIFFHGKWKQFSYEYIAALTEFSYRGAWLYDYLDRGMMFHYFNSLLRKVIKKDMLSNELTYCGYPSKEQFELITREYINKLFCEVNDINCPYLVVDQALPPSDIKRYVNFFDDIKVVVVERDPRDVFMLEKYIRKEQVIPTDAMDFCKWYEYTRRHQNKEEMNTEYSMLIHFEDLIYNYESTVAQIEAFLGIESGQHVGIKTKLIPDKSINNTQIWRRLNLTTKQIAEVELIEKQLSSYLYDFPQIEIREKNPMIE